MDRPELDAWLAEADAVLDEDCYGRSWEADAMHARSGEPYDPEQAAENFLWASWREGIISDDTVRAYAGLATPARQMFLYGAVTDGAGLVLCRVQAEQIRQRYDEAIEALAELGRACARTWTEIWGSLGPALEAISAVGAQPEPPPARRLPVAAQAPVVRSCPRHQEEMRHGQCRLCQRDQIRQASRRWH